MPFITGGEIIDIVIMTLAIGYIFSGFVKREPHGDYDPLEHYQKNQLWEDIKFGAIIAAPAVVFHELAHKFVAMGFGAAATLHAPLGWYLAVIILKMLNFPFLFFVGGYVAHTPLPPLESVLVSFAGPLVNLLFWLAAIIIVKYNLINKKYHRIAILSGKLNLFLFVFNMIPIPGFDGSQIVRGLFGMF